MNQVLYERIKKELLEGEIGYDPYGEKAIARLLWKEQTDEEAIAGLNRAAKWFELPHPKGQGRFLQGEPDFVAHKLIRACYSLEDRLPKQTMELIHEFFTKWDFESVYKSENHMLLFHEARYLYALRYPDALFEPYQMKGAEMAAVDRDFLQEFIRFRAQRGWAEFDSTGYGLEVFAALLNLYDFADEPMSRYAEMSANVMLLDMIMDCSGQGFYGGAHGRIYERYAFSFRLKGMYLLYQLYFGEDETCGACLEPAASTFRPADYVYAVLRARPERWENRECKHLHSITYQTPHRQVPQVPGSISKRTYITPDYMNGGVTWQDDYPAGSEAAWYAHHQQHEWELTILPTEDIRIFTHHPGSCGPEGKEHGYWTGDLFCCCGQFFSEGNVAMATYDIPESEEGFIHASVPFSRLEVVREENYLWMKAHKRVYAALWFSQGISDGREDLREKEVRSCGRKHGVVCVVSTREESGSFSAFQEMVRAGHPRLDPDTMTLTYSNLMMNRKEWRVNGETVRFPYETYDSPCVFSRWGSGVIETAEVILDFDGWGRVIRKKEAEWSE